MNEKISEILDGLKIFDGIYKRELIVCPAGLVLIRPKKIQFPLKRQSHQKYQPYKEKLKR